MRIRIIDACLQRRQRRWTLEDIHRACEDALYELEGVDGISVRTVQRDIELMRSGKLGYCAPIIVKDRKYYTYEDPDFSITQLPLSRKDIAELNSALDIIRHYSGFAGMSGQDDILTRMQDHIRSQENHRQVVFIETNSRLKGLDFLGTLYDLIIRRQPVKVGYKSFKSHRQVVWHLSPYLLKEYNNRWFLIAHDKTTGIVTLALDRIVEIVTDSEGIYTENTFFTPETYLDDMVGVTRSVHSKKETVTLRVDAEQTPYVITKPIHGSQQVIREYEDGSADIGLEVIHNFELERVILGFGSHVEVLSPQHLRRRIADALLEASAKYAPGQIF